MWFTVVPMLPPVGACIGRKKIRTLGNSMISCMLVPTLTDLAAERVDEELLLRVHVGRVQVVMAVDDRAVLGDEQLAPRRATARGERESQQGEDEQDVVSWVMPPVRASLNELGLPDLDLIPHLLTSRYSDVDSVVSGGDR